MLIISIVLTIFSLVFLLIISLAKKRLSRNALLALLFPLLLLCVVTAYHFDWYLNSNNDLARWIEDIYLIRINGFNTTLRYSDSLSIGWKAILWAAGYLQDFHWFAAISIAVETLIYYYIVVSLYVDSRISTMGILSCALVKFAFVPLILSVAAFRSTLAFAFFSLGILLYSKHRKIRFSVLLTLGISLLIHSQMIIVIVVFIISIFIRERRALNIILVFYPLALALVSQALTIVGFGYGDYLLFKLNVYSQYAVLYDTYKMNRYIVPIIIFSILLYIWYFRDSDKESRLRSCYLLSIFPVIIGSFFISSTLFIRLCLSIGFLYPLLESEMVGANRKLYTRDYILYLNVVLLVVLTNGCWLPSIISSLWKI